MGWFAILLGVVAIVMTPVQPVLVRDNLWAYPRPLRNFAVRFVSSPLYKIGGYAAGVAMVLIGVITLL